MKTKKISLGSFVALGFAISILFAQGAQAVVTIVSAVPHYPEQTLTINGGGFGNGVPFVTLDNMQLFVTSHTPTTIEANLPVDLAAGSYHLSVRTGAGSGLLDVTLGE